MPLQVVNPEVGADTGAASILIRPSDGRFLFRNVETELPRCAVLTDPATKGLADPSTREIGFKFGPKQGYAVAKKGKQLTVKALAIFKEYPWIKPGLYTLKYDKSAKMWVAKI